MVLARASPRARLSFFLSLFFTGRLVSMVAGGPFAERSFYVTAVAGIARAQPWTPSFRAFLKISL